MTLVAVHRLPRSAVFLSDTRLTETVTDPIDGVERKVQGDEVAKFIDADNRVRLFAAGPVSFWQEAANVIESVADQITAGNAAEMHGPLHTAVGILAAGKPRTDPNRSGKPPPDGGALGFVVDTGTEKNCVVYLKVTFGLGAEVEEVGPGESLLIGSGSGLAGLRDRFHGAAVGLTQSPIFNEDSPDPLATLFNVLRHNILSAFGDAGPGSHAQFNTGSFLVGGVLLDDWSCLVGEQLYDFRSGAGASVYTLTGDDDGLVVRSGNTASQLLPLRRAATHVTQSPVDPQGREIETGLQGRFPHATTVYQVIQWSHDAARFAGLVLGGVNHGEGVRKLIGGQARAFRSVYRIDKGTRERVGLASRQTDVLTSEEVEWYPSVQSHYFEVEDGLQSEFERDVACYAFDHDWWRRFIPDYDGLLFSDPGVALRPPTA